MSRTYIGPFGRILPVLPDTEPLRSEETHAPIEGNITKMATYQLPPPTGLQFGSDPFHGFSEHNRYDAVRHPRSSCEQPRTDYQEPPRNSYHEQLPSVSQLLTPGSQSSIPTSPYSSQYSPDPPEPRATQVANRRCNVQESPLQVNGGYSQQGGYSTAPSSQHYVVEHDLSVGNGYQAMVHQPQAQIPTPTVNHASTIPSPYVHFAPEHRQDTYMHQPRPIAPLTAAAHYYQAPMVNYDQPMGSATALNQGLPAAGNIVKPLPRLVGEKMVPGEGPCWVYEDGSICKKVIDGEEVNAQWGVTKAGKPRKRLAIACTTCREKKIKCDPAEPKCVQCEKFGRVCRFTTARTEAFGSSVVRSAHHSSDRRLHLVVCKAVSTFHNQYANSKSPSYDLQARTPSSSINTRRSSPMPSHSRLCSEQSKAEPCPRLEDQDSKPANKRATQQRDSFGHLQRHYRMTREHHRQSSPDVTVKVEKSEPSDWNLAAIGSIPMKSSSPATNFDWQNDPIDVSRETSLAYIDHFFDFTDIVTFYMVPRRRFMDWVKRETRKSRDDIIFLYALLALGLMLSSDQEKEPLHRLFCSIASTAISARQGPYSVQIVQSYLVLAVYHLAMDERDAARQSTGNALRTAVGLDLHLEPSVAKDTSLYGLSRNEIQECHRRTFWSVFMADRLFSLGFHWPLGINSDDIFLRLPCRETLYGVCEETPVPFYANSITGSQLCKGWEPSKLGACAHVVQITSIWSDVATDVYRSPYRSAADYEENQQRLISATHDRLESWTSALPNHMMFNVFNTESSIAGGYFGAYISIHVIYHTIIMTIHRNIRCMDNFAARAAGNIEEAKHNAKKTLQIMKTVTGAISTKFRENTTADPCFNIALPITFTMHAIAMATEILSAFGCLLGNHFRETLTLLGSGPDVLELLGVAWASARRQGQVMKVWLDRFTRSLEEGTKADENRKAWVMMTPMTGINNRGLGDLFYYDSLQERAGHRMRISDLLELHEDEILLINY